MYLKTPRDAYLVCKEIQHAVAMVTDFETGRADEQLEATRRGFDALADDLAALPERDRDAVKLILTTKLNEVLLFFRLNAQALLFNHRVSRAQTSNDRAAADNAFDSACKKLEADFFGSR
jgi:hypothetical protein